MRHNSGMAKRTLHERLIDAQALASRWLADANELAESGRKDKAERFYEKAQYWLDRANELEVREFCEKRK